MALIYIFLSLPSFGNPSIEIQNLQEDEITNVTINVKNNIININRIGKRSAKVVELENSFGESSIKFSYVFNGELKEWEGGYIESNRYYIIDLRINPDGTIYCSSSLNRTLLDFFI